LARVRALDADQPPPAVDVMPPKRAELSEPKTRAQRDIEEADEEEIRLAPERIEWRQFDERLADRIRVLRRDLLARKVLGRGQVSSCGRIREEQALPDRVGQQLAERDDDVAYRARCLAVRLEFGD
jgi:hypothetical protein